MIFIFCPPPQKKITICLCFNLNCAAGTKNYWVGGLHGHLGCTEADSSAKGIFFAKTICKKKKQTNNSGLRQLGCVVLELCFELEAERCVKETMGEIGVYLFFYWQLIDGSCLLSIKKDALPWGYPLTQHKFRMSQFISAVRRTGRRCCVEISG